METEYVGCMSACVSYINILNYVIAISYVYYKYIQNLI